MLGIYLVVHNDCRISLVNLCEYRIFIMYFCFFQSNVSGHKNIVGYIDSCVSHVGNGVYEVLLLMAHCKSHVLALMNSRFQHQSSLTEFEVFNFFI